MHHGADAVQAPPLGAGPAPGALAGGGGAGEAMELGVPGAEGASLRRSSPDSGGGKRPPPEGTRPPPSLLRAHGRFEEGPVTSAAAVPSAGCVGLRGRFAAEDIVTQPLPGCSHPASLGYGAGGSLVCALFAPDYSLQRRLYALARTGDKDMAVPPPGGSGAGAGAGSDFANPWGRGGTAELLVAPPRRGHEGNLSVEEALRRERTRERGMGITRYAWASRGPPRCVIPLPGGVFLFECEEGGRGGRGLRCLAEDVPGVDPALEPQLSPDGEAVAFVRGGDLFCVPTVAPLGPAGSPPRSPCSLPAGPAPPV